MSAMPTVRVWRGGLHGWVRVPAPDVEPESFDPLEHARVSFPLVEEPEPYEPIVEREPDCSWSGRSYFPPDYPRSR